MRTYWWVPIYGLARAWYLNRRYYHTVLWERYREARNLAVLWNIALLILGGCVVSVVLTI